MLLKIPFKLLLCFLLMPLMVLANTDLKPIKATKERRIKKTFNVSSDATLKVKNSFGNITVITWNENRIDFDISIKVSGNNEEKVQDRLDRIDVRFSSSSDLVSATTEIGKNEKKWWDWGKKMNLKVEIDYIIKLPISNNIDLNNEFGSITVDELKGAARLNCDFGKIVAKALLSQSNNISFTHSQNCYFDYINSGTIKAEHSGFTIAKTENIIIDAEHSKSTIEASENVTYNCDFGSIHVENVNMLEGKGEHLTTRIGTVFKNLSLDNTHGTVKIERLAPSVNNVTLDSEFTSMTIGYDAELSFNFDLNLEFGSLRDSDGFNFTSKEIDHSDKRYKGYYGTRDAGTVIKVNSEHGNLSFKKL